MMKNRNPAKSAKGVSSTSPPDWAFARVSSMSDLWAMLSDQVRVMSLADQACARGYALWRFVARRSASAAHPKNAEPQGAARMRLQKLQDPLFAARDSSLDAIARGTAIATNFSRLTKDML